MTVDGNHKMDQLFTFESELLWSQSEITFFIEFFNQISSFGLSSSTHIIPINGMTKMNNDCNAKYRDQMGPIIKQNGHGHSK